MSAVTLAFCYISWEQANFLHLYFFAFVVAVFHRLMLFADVMLFVGVTAQKVCHLKYITTHTYMLYIKLLRCESLV